MVDFNRWRRQSNKQERKIYTIQFKEGRQQQQSSLPRKAPKSNHQVDSFTAPLVKIAIFSITQKQL